MVFATKGTAQGRVGGVQHLATQEHGYLSGLGNVLVPFGSGQIAHPDIEMFADHTHDFLGCQVVRGLFLGVGQNMLEVLVRQVLLDQLLEGKELE